MGGVVDDTSCLIGEEEREMELIGEDIVSNMLRVGMVIDQGRHGLCWKAVERHFLGVGGKATVRSVDTDALMKQRRKMRDRVETQMFIDAPYAKPRVPLTLYIYHGVSVSNLKLLQTEDHEWGRSMLLEAMHSFQASNVRSPSEIPGVLVYACGNVDPIEGILRRFFPSIEEQYLEESVRAHIPWLSPDMSAWIDTLVPSRYAYYVNTVQTRRKSAREELSDYLDVSQRLPGTTSLPPPPSLVGSLDGRVDIAHERAIAHRKIQDLLPEALEVSQFDPDFFHETNNRALSVQQQVLEEVRLKNMTTAFEATCALDGGRKEDTFDIQTVASDSSRGSSVGSYYSEDASTRLFYSDLSRQMGIKPIMETMTANNGSVDRFSASSDAMVPFTVIKSCYQLSAAAFATLNHVLSSVERKMAADKSSCLLYCTSCQNLRKTYRKLRMILSKFKGGRPDLSSSMDTSCVACATILAICSAVMNYGCDMCVEDRKTAVNKYLLAAIGSMAESLCVDTLFLKAMLFFRNMADAVEHHRRPWSCNYNLYPTIRNSDSNVVSLRCSPTVCCDESLAVTAQVLSSWTKLGPVRADLYRNTLTFSKPGHKSVIDVCFNPCTDILSDRPTVTSTTNHRTVVDTCVDHGYWNSEAVLDTRPTTGESRYLYPDTLFDTLDAVSSGAPGLLTRPSEPFIPTEDLSYEYVYAWPLLVRNFLHGSDDLLSADSNRVDVSSSEEEGGDIRLYQSVYGLQKMIFSKWSRGRSRSRKSTIITPTCTSGVPIRIYTILPKLLRKVLLRPTADGGTTAVFDLLTAPFMTAAKKAHEHYGATTIPSESPVEVKITSDATWTIYSALWTFVHALSERLIVIDTVIESLHNAFRNNRRLREEHLGAARLCALLCANKDRCRTEGHFHIPNPFYSGKCGGTTFDGKVRDICLPLNTPPHFLIYRVLLSDHISPTLAFNAFMGISSRQHWRSRGKVVASMAYFVDKYASPITRKPEGVVASFRRARVMYEDHVSDSVWLDDDDGISYGDSYSVMAELFATLEVMTRFSARIQEADRRDIIERKKFITGPIDVLRPSIYRGLLTREYVFSLAFFTNHRSIVCSRFIPLLGSWLDSSSATEEPRRLSTADTVPIWYPMLLPTHMDHYRLMNVVRGPGELAPFAGAHPDFLMAVVTEPIERVTIPSTSDFGVSLNHYKVYSASEWEEKQWTKNQVAQFLYGGESDLMPRSVHAGSKRKRRDSYSSSSSSSGGEEEEEEEEPEESNKRRKMVDEGYLGIRIRKLRESGNGPDVTFVPKFKGGRRRRRERVERASPIVD